MKFAISIIVAGAALFLSACANTPKSSKAEKRPNVILMMADDLANEDLSCYGSTRIDTPNLDNMAKEGLKLTSFYAGNPVCSPSRMALLSGAYPARIGWRWGVLGYGFPPKTGMSTKVYTMAEAFRDAGYHTAMSGKWHLGVKNMRPEDQGFESVYCIYMSNNQNRDMYRDGKLVKKDWDNRLLTKTFAEEAIRIIREDRDEPFFLYLPWTAPHFPADPHPDWLGKYGTDKSGNYADVVAELDHRVGEILKALEESGQADNTIVIFTSGNGRQSGQEGPDDTPPYSGQKWQSLEGGTRVPFILRYPEVIPADREYHEIIAAIDLFPTLAEACGVDIKLPEQAQKMDGFSAWQNLQQLTSNGAREELLYWHGRGNATGIRIGEWKLLFNYGEQRPAVDPPLENGPALYHLSSDPLEKTNLAAKHPEKVEKMMARARTLLTAIYANPMQLGSWPGVDPPEPPLKASEVWGQWMK